MTLTWWQLGLLKLAVLVLGIAIGANWPEVFMQYTVVLVTVGLLLSIYLTVVWFKR